MKNILLSTAAAINLLVPPSTSDTQAFSIYPLSQEADPAIAGHSAILSFNDTRTHDPSPLSVAGIFPSGLSYDNDDGFFEVPDISLGCSRRCFCKLTLRQQEL